MNDENYYSIKMRASKSGDHISGAERIVNSRATSQVVEALATRALHHSKGTPDFINIKLEQVNFKKLQHLQALPVRTECVHTPEEGIQVVKRILSKVGDLDISTIFKLFRETYSMRGAMLLDADSLERLEPDKDRGVRATYMDAEFSSTANAGGKNHYAEAIVLATKVANAPGIIGEICISDDPDYVTGYVATKEEGYVRITCMKKMGSPDGGRIFLYRGPKEKVAECIRFLEKVPVIIDNVKPLPQKQTGEEIRNGIFAGMNSEMETMEKSGLKRKMRLFQSAAGTNVALKDAGNVLMLGSNDYLDLANDPRIKKAAAAALAVYGTGSGGSRLTTGTLPPHEALERHLAKFKGTESAVLYATGYMANVGIISALCNKEDFIFSDALNHASIIDGCRLSRANVVVYAHNDMDDLKRKLAECKNARKKLIVSDAVFSMDGDILNLSDFLGAAKEFGAISMVDEAHSTGVCGKTGHGVCELFGSAGKPDILMGTLSKALGAEGGFACVNSFIADYLRNHSRAFIFSTSPTPADAAAADAALSVLEAEPERASNVKLRAEFFAKELQRQGVDAKYSGTAIVPIVLGDERLAMSVSEELLNQYIYAPAIRYPTVARGEARLRISVIATHTEAELSRAAALIKKAISG